MKIKLSELQKSLNHNNKGLQKIRDIPVYICNSSAVLHKSQEVEEEVDLVEAPSSEDQLKEKLPKSHGKLK